MRPNPYAYAQPQPQGGWISGPVALATGCLICALLFAAAVTIVLSLIPVYVRKNTNPAALNFNRVSSSIPITFVTTSITLRNGTTATITNTNSLARQLEAAYGLPAGSLTITSVQINGFVRNTGRRRRGLFRRRRALPSCNQFGSPGLLVTISVVVVFPKKCGFSARCKQNFFNLVVARINAFTGTITATVIFSDGTSATVVLNPCSGLDGLTIFGIGSGIGGGGAGGGTGAPCTQPLTGPTAIASGVAPTPVAIATGDLVNDGAPFDIATANIDSNTVSIFLNPDFNPAYNGPPPSQTITLPPGSAPSAIAIGNVDGAPGADIVVALRGTNSIAVALNPGTGLFSTANFQILTLGGNLAGPTSVAVGNLNAVAVDGFLDIVVANGASASITFVMNTAGILSFTPTNLALPAGTVPVSVALGDLDAGVFQDIVVVDSGSNNVYYFINPAGVIGARTLLTLPAPATRSVSVAIGNVVGTADNDIVIANTAPDGITIFTGPPPFAAPPPEAAPRFIATAAGSTPSSITTGDINAALGRDIVVTNAGTNNVNVFFGPSPGFFPAAATPDLILPMGAGIGPVSVAANQLDGVGPMDIAVADRNSRDVAVFQSGAAPIVNGAAPTIIAPLSTAPGIVTPTSVALGSLNNDAFTDMAVANRGSRDVAVFLNNAGQFTGVAPQFLHTSRTAVPESVAIGTLNADAFGDVVVANSGTNQVAVYLSNAGVLAGVAPQLIPIAAGAPTFITVGNLDNTRFDDIVILSRAAGTATVVMNPVNPLAYAAAPQINIALGGGTLPSSAAIGNFDNVGFRDIAIANSGTNNVFVLLGPTYATPPPATQIVTLTAGAQPSSIAIGDFTGNGLGDLAIANSALNTITIVINPGATGAWNTATQQTINLPTGSQPFSIAFADFNLNGVLDIVVANRLSNNIMVLLGLGGGAFSNVQILSTGTPSTPVSLATGDINADGRPDVVVANNAANNIAIFTGIC